MPSTLHALQRAIVCALAVGTASTAAEAALLPQSWNGWRWARSGALSIHLGDNVSSAWDPYLLMGARQWSVDPVIDFVLKAGRSSSPLSCNAIYGTIQACSANYGATGWLGWTQVWTSGSYIVQATVKLNDYYFQSGTYNTTSYRAQTACHELGHSLGLEDLDVSFTNLNRGSCLDYTNDPSGTKGTNGTLANIAPGNTDLTNLARIYATVGGNQIAATKPIIMRFGAYAVPEPATWALMIAGFGVMGAACRRKMAVRA